MTRFFILFSFLFISVFSFSQQLQERVTTEIVQQDSLFWKAYNSCDVEGMNSFFTKDVEFYHDKGGASFGLDTLAAIFKKNLCSRDDFRLRREPVAGSYKVFTLENRGTLYGAILSGEHVFYINEKGKPEFLDGLAKFTHVWLLKDGKWKMARVLSYDHGPANRK